MAYSIVFSTSIVCASVQYYLKHGRALATVSPAEPMALTSGREAALAAGALPSSAATSADLPTQIPQGVVLAPGDTWL